MYNLHLKKVCPSNIFPIVDNFKSPIHNQLVNPLKEFSK